MSQNSIVSLISMSAFLVVLAGLIFEVRVAYVACRSKRPFVTRFIVRLVLMVIFFASASIGVSIAYPGILEAGRDRRTCVSLMSHPLIPHNEDQCYAMERDELARLERR